MCGAHLQNIIQIQSHVNIVPRKYFVKNVLFIFISFHRQIHLIQIKSTHYHNNDFCNACNTDTNNNHNFAASISSASASTSSIKLSLQHRHHHHTVDYVCRYRTKHAKIMHHQYQYNGFVVGHHSTAHISNGIL